MKKGHPAQCVTRSQKKAYIAAQVSATASLTEGTLSDGVQAAVRTRTADVLARYASCAPVLSAPIRSGLRLYDALPASCIPIVAT
jgi:hypothetical protein